ncbi:MAG: hypothetical protein E7292_12100 [Lachnospiraceae bacterium]|nr:hypothetical protein [Lachnospiraceae bacterium]
MKKMILNIMATTGITLVVLALVATCYGGTVIFISAIFQALVLNIIIYAGIFLLNHFEYRYPVVETGLKLVYVLAVVLACGWLCGWYGNMSVVVLGGMTIVIFGVCVCLDTLSLIDEVKMINGLIENKR